MPPSVNSVVIDDVLAGRLLASQLPQFAGLPLRRFQPAGSDNVIFRLGDDLAMRIPRHAGAARQAEAEHRWAPYLAQRLPLAVPVQVGFGWPEFGYPWHWSVSKWLDGEPATVDGLADPAKTAVDLAEFLTTLWALPLPAERDDALACNSLRGRDESTRAAIASVRDAFDERSMTQVWDEAVAAPEWDGPAGWFHGDMHNGNLLTVDGHLHAVIDFGAIGLGDPACDLVVAWTLFSPTVRPVFLEALGVDDATRTRGRGWALTTGLSAYTAYAATNPTVAANTTRQITQALIG